jgi:hypothetical protein
MKNMQQSESELHGEKIGRVVATEESPSFSTVIVRLDAGKRVRPGEILLSPASLEDSKKDYIILRVSDAREYNEYENPLDSQVRDIFDVGSPRGREDLLRKFVLARTQPIELVHENSDSTWASEDPHLLIPSGTEVYVAASGIIDKVLGFTDPKDPAAIEIGEVVGSSGIRAVLDANKVLPRHILVVGSTGTGKSYLMGVISEQLKKIGIRHINIDIHGEMAKAAEQLEGQNLIPGKELTVQLSSLSEPEVMEMLPITNELHRDIAVKAFSNLKKTGRKFGVDDFREEAVSVTKEYGAKKSTEEIMKARIDTLHGIEVLGSGFDWVGALQNDGAFINLDCREISSHSELKIIVGAIARELMSLRKRNKIRELVLSMDEAHLFLPSGEISPSSQVLGELIRFGRHHGVGIIIASQSPNDVDRRIAKITNTRLFFAIEQSELGSVGGLLGDTPEDFVKNLPRLKTGTCLLVGSRDTVKHSQIIQVGKRTTQHGGETPRMI